MWWYCCCLGHVFVTACIITGLGHSVFPPIFYNFLTLTTILLWYVVVSRGALESRRGAGTTDSCSLVFSRRGVWMPGLPSPSPRSAPTSFTGNLVLVLRSVTETPTPRAACNWQMHRNTQTQTNAHGKGEIENKKKIFVSFLVLYLWHRGSLKQADCATSGGCVTQWDL